MPKYVGVAHVQWELPFPLRLPPSAFLCWEPQEGTAAFLSGPAVGTLSWSRSSPLLSTAEVFPDTGPGMTTLPTHDYRITSVLRSGREVITAELTRGPDGGFNEPRPFSVANVMLCLRTTSGSWADGTVERAAAALNNLLDIYRFLTLDPLARSINGQRDTYYTLISLASIPESWPDGSARDTLLRVDELSFGSVIGQNRTHVVGANSYDDLYFGGALPPEHVDLFDRLSAGKHSLELFHVLIFDAIRRLKRFECALAVLDAESAFEVLVSTILSEILSQRGVDRTEIESSFAPRGQFDSHNKRLTEIDRVAASEATAANEPVRQFFDSPACSAWRQDLYRVRHRVVHEGLRDVSFDVAKRAVQTGLKAAHAVQDLRPSFNRRLNWSGDALDLPHITQSAGRLSRIFEA